MGLFDKLPRSKVELQNVSGFGPVKSEKYGDMLLKILLNKDKVCK